VARTTNNLLAGRKFSEAAEEGGDKYGQVVPDPLVDSLRFPKGVFANTYRRASTQNQP